MIDNLPVALRDANLPLPNVYWVTVDSATHGQHSLYLAAEFSGEAIRKVQRLCVDRHGFRPHRANAVIRLRRFRLGDYLECPEGLQAAYKTAQELNERDTVAKLGRRHAEVEAVLAEAQQPASTGAVDFDQVEAALVAELRAIG